MPVQTMLNLPNALKLIAADTKFVMQEHLAGRASYPHTFMLYSLPGIGKTEGIRSLAQDADHLCVIDINAEFGGSLAMPIQNVEYRDIPAKPGTDSSDTTPRKRAVAHVLHALDERINRLANLAYNHPHETYWLLLDEANRGDEFMTQTIMQLLLEKRLPGYKLPFNIFVIGAGNTATNIFTKETNIENDVNQFDTAIRDRLNPLFIHLDVNAWLDYAYTNGVHPDVIQFIERAEKPEGLLYRAPHSDDDTGATPRSWTRLTGLLQNPAIRNDRTIMRAALASQIGEELATRFNNFLGSSNFIDIPKLLKVPDLDHFDHKLSPVDRRTFLLLAPRYLERDPALVNDFATYLTTTDQAALQRFITLLVTNNVLSTQYPETNIALRHLDVFNDMLAAYSANNL